MLVLSTISIEKLQWTLDIHVYVLFLFYCSITAYFNKQGWPAVAPATDEERKEFVASLHKRKTGLFMELIEKKLLPLRPGVARYICMIL